MHKQWPVRVLPMCNLNFVEEAVITKAAGGGSKKSAE